MKKGIELAVKVFDILRRSGTADFAQKLIGLRGGGVDAKRLEQFFEEERRHQPPGGSSIAQLIFGAVTVVFELPQDGANLRELFLVGKTVRKLQRKLADIGTKFFVGLLVDFRNAESRTFDNEGEKPLRIREPGILRFGRLQLTPRGYLPKVHPDALLPYLSAGNSAALGI